MSVRPIFKISKAHPPISLGGLVPSPTMMVMRITKWFKREVHGLLVFADFLDLVSALAQF